VPLWKQLLLHAYYHAMRPARAWNYWREASKDRVPVAILYYHRVADDRATPWTMSCAMFERQIAWLADRFDFISLDDAQQRIRRGYNPQPCVSITFDDGYAENCHSAIPRLVRDHIPCTYFVTLQNVLNEEPFAHDLVRGRRLAPNTLEQLRAMAGAGVEIGCHGYTHADLGPITDRRLLEHEIVASRDRLQDLLGRPIRYFAFPYGLHANLSAAAFDIAQAAGYAGVCSAYGGFNFPGDEAFHLQRIPADNTMVRLKNWMTFDPRKLRTPRFAWEPTNQATATTGRGFTMLAPSP
jgi:peptidoglycan/xylan/chitin deacetylase (PgdA/CDA1 family)